MNDSTKPEIRPLTFFRFLTAFFVFLFHVKIHLEFKLSVDMFDRFIQQSAIFMTAFFVLSGFILHLIYHNKDFSVKENRREFYIKRIAKIYPAYAATAILAYFFMNNVTFAQGITAIPMTILCLQSLFFSAFPYLLNGGLWSLSVEAVFYYIFPFIQQTFNFNKYNKVILFVSYFATIYPSIVQCYFGGTNDLYVNPFFRIPEFIFGMCVANLYLKRNVQKQKSGGRHVVLCITVLVVLIAILSKNKFFNGTYFANNYTYFNCACVPIIGGLIYFFSIVKNKLILSFTNNSISNYLGKISYCFYLTQFIAIGVFGKRYFCNIGWKSMVMPLLINIILASLLYELVERKCRVKIINKLIKRRSSYD